MIVRRRTKLIVGLIGAGALVAIWLSFGSSGEPKLRDVAQPVNLMPGDEIDTIIWLSDHEFIISRRHITTNNRGSHEIVKRDISTGNEVRLSAIEALASEDEFHSLSPTVSPDGKRITVGQFLTDLTGRIVYNAGRGARANNWLNGSSQVVWLSSKTKAAVEYWQIVDIDRPSTKPIQGITSIPFSAVSSGLQSALNISPQRIRYVSLRYNADDSTFGFGPSKSGATVTDTDPSTSRSIGAFNILFPRNSVLNGVAFNSSANKAAWILNRPSISLVDQFRIKVLGQTLPVYSAHEGIWVSNIDGSKMHEVGYCNAAATRGTTTIKSLVWLPGERRLGFQLNGRYYTVTAD